MVTHLISSWEIITRFAVTIDIHFDLSIAIIASILVVIGTKR